MTLPVRTVRRLERVAKRGNRSRMIAVAIERYVGEVEELRRRLKEGAIRRTHRGMGVAEAWFHLEEEARTAGSRCGTERCRSAR